MENPCDAECLKLIKPAGVEQGCTDVYSDNGGCGKSSQQTEQ